MLRSTLSSLPESLNNTYRTMLASIKPELIDFARQVLNLLCFSAGPIEVTELIEALAVVVNGDTSRFDVGNKLSGADDLLKICPGIIRILGPATSDYDPPSSKRGRGFSELSISRRVWRKIIYKRAREAHSNPSLCHYNPILRMKLPYTQRILPRQEATYFYPAYYIPSRSFLSDWLSQ